MTYFKRIHAVVISAFLFFAGTIQPARGDAPVDARAAYDPTNAFAQILRGELPADVVFENDHALTFHDIRPQATVHVVVIPKGPYSNINRFNANASSAEKLGFLEAISRTAKIMGVEESGFRLINNTGLDSGQTVAHMHFHLLGGEYVGSPREAAPGQEGALIEALYARYAMAWLKNDDSTADTVLSLFSEKGVIVPSGGKMMFTGHKEMRGFWFPPDAPTSTVDRFDHETIIVTMVGREGTLLSRFSMQFTMDGVSYRTEGFNQMSAIFDLGEWRISTMMWNHPPWEKVAQESVVSE